MILKCKRCEKEFECAAENPVACGLCKSRLWNDERVRLPGGGRKPAVESPAEGFAPWDEPGSDPRTLSSVSPVLAEIEDCAVRENIYVDEDPAVCGEVVDNGGRNKKGALAEWRKAKKGK